MAKQPKQQISATANNIVDLLSAIHGARIVTITTKTVPVMVAKAEIDGKIVRNPFIGKTLKDAHIRKVARVNGVVNWNYTSAVNRQRTREGATPDFVAEPRKWGTRLKGLPFVIHTNQKSVTHLYLEMKVQRSLDHWYETVDGQPIDAAAVKPFLRPNGKSRQEVDKEVILRDYRMDRILAIAHEGAVYVVEGNLTLAQDIAAIRS